MPYKIIHEDGSKILAVGGTPKELFHDSAKGLLEFMGPRPLGGKRTVARAVIVHAKNPDFLLMEFLNKVYSSAETYKETYATIDFKHLSPTFLEVHLTGENVAGFKRELKAVTYRDTGLEHNEGKWRARLFLEA